MARCPADMGFGVTKEPNTQAPLVVKITVEIITYAIYFAWLSVIAAGALYFGVPPLPAIEDAVAGPWQGTAAAVALGALSIAALRVIYEALRARMPKKSETQPPAPSPTEPPPEPTASTPAVKRTKKKRRRKKRKR